MEWRERVQAGRQGSKECYDVYFDIKYNEKMSTNAELENIKANTSSNESFCDHPHEVASPLVLAQACAIVIVFAERIRYSLSFFNALQCSSRLLLFK